jgi:hypothetical protein
MGSALKYTKTQVVNEMRFSDCHSLSTPFLRSDSPGESRTPWLTHDFEQRFRDAFGREMNREERQFFGLSATVPDAPYASEAEPDNSDSRS